MDRWVDGWIDVAREVGGGGGEGRGEWSPGLSGDSPAECLRDQNPSKLRGERQEENEEHKRKERKIDL